MNARNANVVNLLDAITHQPGGQNRFFADANVAGSRGNHGNRAFASDFMIAFDGNHAGKRVEFRGFADAFDGSKYFGVRAGYQHIVLAALMPQHRVHNFRHLYRCFSFAEDDFGKPLAERTMVIHLRKSNIFKGQMLDPLHRGASREFSALHRFQKVQNFFSSHELTRRNFTICLSTYLCLTWPKTAEILNVSAQTMLPAKGKTITVGVTGASGAIFAQKTLAMLEEDQRVTHVHLVVTETGQRLFAEELGLSSGDLKKLPARIIGHASKKIAVLPNRDVGASIASGSYEVSTMIVIPCTMGALSAIANGMSDDLVGRSADVMLKEGRKLILCVRDTPLNRIHLENMLRAQQAGAVIMPVVPAFYDNPRSIDDIVTQFCCRVLSQAGLPQEQMHRWTGSVPRKKSES